MQIDLDNGQMNLLVSGLGLAAAAVGKGDPYGGYPDDYLKLRDEIQAQGGGPAGSGALRRLQHRRITDSLAGR